MSDALTLPEEITLLTLDDETGQLVGRLGLAASLALAGAVLMELALANRLDTEGDVLALHDPTPTGDAVLDAALVRLEGLGSSRAALATLSGEAATLRPLLLDRLVGRGILRVQAVRVLWVFPNRRYPTAEGHREPEAVRVRLRAAVLDDAIPEPRDTLLIALARAAGLLPLLLPAEELEAAAPRLALLGRLEALGRSLGAAVADVYAARLRAGTPGD